MEKKQGKINSGKLVKTAFWAVILVLVLFFGKKLLPGEENGVKEEGNQYEDGGVSGNESEVGYRENDGDELREGVNVAAHGGEQYVEAASSGSWGLGFGADGSEKQPNGSLSKEELREYDAWYLGDDKEKVLYLTFDCGYENGNTEKILDALKKHNAKGTFFVVGHFLESAPDLVKRMSEEGHMVGNHTWHHLDMDALAEEAKFREELDTVADKYKEITGKELDRFYRPPQGKYNLENLAMAKKLGYQTVFWSLAYVDWNVDAQPTQEEAFAKLTGRVHPGAVVLLHNTSKTNGEILDELLTKWEEMGYRFGALEDLTS
ncbi:MAG: polysaccharide deacetylase family protein [Lachnospiraceae bacterium]|nr:polysaccharide deacetylase family protein [Lachnospiraceae bacterium]